VVRCDCSVWVFLIVHLGGGSDVQGSWAGNTASQQGGGGAISTWETDSYGHEYTVLGDEMSGVGEVVCGGGTGAGAV